jgi:hypothetical protein
MIKKVIEKVITQYGVRLEIDFGSVRSNLYFDDEAELDGFVCMLRMMVSMGAASVSIECPDQEEETEEADNQENKTPAKTDAEE